jgi:hypothetical protein
MPPKILIVGAGPAGMTAAIAAARSGASVTILEAMDRPGKKLLLTGNGRCNLTNKDELLPTRYYGTGADLAGKILPQFPVSETLAFFESLGLWTMEKNGYVYPATAQAASVLELLLAELRRLKVKMKYTEKVQSLTRTEGIWQVQTATWQYQADAVILACGSKAVPLTGSDGSGYELAAALGHRIIRPAPALVPLTCKGDSFAALAGVRSRAEVSLMDGEQLVKKEAGELQWTKYGVSGIVIFQLSRFVSADEEGKQFHLLINLLPEQDPDRVKAQLQKRAQELPNEKVTVLFTGLLHTKLIPYILKTAGISQKLTCRDLTEAQLQHILDTASGLCLTVTGTKSFEESQVCSGGVDGRELSDTLESLKAERLYFAGELIDIDGPCGGYNLQWAWSSGYVAGIAAAQAEISQ